MSAGTARTTTVDELAGALRREILEGRRGAGSRLAEQDLCTRFGVARHSLRAALRALAAERLVQIEPHRGARVARLGAQDVIWLYELRAALECEAARLALERHGGRLPAAVHAARDRLTAACGGAAVIWSAVNEAHAGLHAAIVAAAGAPRIAAAHAALSGELRLFLLQLEPLWSAARMAADHVALVARLESEGPDALREHLREAAEALAAAERSPRRGRAAGAARPAERREEGLRGIP
jgi:DNA-binding GntR family transcriptional regulator